MKKVASQSFLYRVLLLVLRVETTLLRSFQSFIGRDANDTCFHGPVSIHAAFGKIRKGSDIVWKRRVKRRAWWWSSAMAR